MDVYNSKVAKLLCKWSKANKYAITTSKTCARYSCPIEGVSTPWRKHEETHKAQFARMGWIKFVVSYILETIKNGYTNNKYEVEARNNQ